MTIHAARIAESSQTTKEGSFRNPASGKWLDIQPCIRSHVLAVSTVATGSQSEPSIRGLFLASRTSAFPPCHMYKHASGATGKKNLGSWNQGQSKYMNPYPAKYHSCSPSPVFRMEAYQPKIIRRSGQTTKIDIQ